MTAYPASSDSRELVAAILAEMEVRPAVDDDLAAMVELAAHQQSDPARVIVYLGTEADGIRSELEDIDWRSVSAVVSDDRIVGWLVGDVDAELGRVYWLGPFIAVDAWDDVATRLYTSCRGVLPPGVTQEEMAIDSRFERYGSWAAARGFTAGNGSLELRLESSLDVSDFDAGAVRAIRDDDRGTLGVLHEQLFPGTHTTGRQLVEDRDDDRLRLVTEVDGSLAGYVAFVVQPDGAGYIDYLGVATEFRGRGIGAQLVRAASASLTRRGAAPVHLTVREDNQAARRLYAASGFTEQRLIVPLRKGFELT